MATDFASICRGKRIGYVGEFGKIQIDELCHHYGMDPSEYTAVRCGMNVAQVCSFLKFNPFLSALLRH